MGEHGKPTPVPETKPPVDPKQKQDGALPDITKPGPGRRRKDR